MAIYRQGITTSNGNNNSNSNSSGGAFNTLKSLVDNNSSLFKIVRVLDIVLDENHPKFKDVGEWNGIGTIYFEDINNSTIISTFAYPLNPQIKLYPLVNEIVSLIYIPSKFVDSSQNTKIVYYYFPPTGIWNHPHHNAYPNITTYEALNKNQKDDYVNAGGEYVRRVEDNSTEINLNYTKFPNPSQDTFQEKPNIHPILPFSGDIIYEGRYGQSLRFGNTAKSNSILKNNWSTAGNNGDPITILRNGQPTTTSDEGWIPITENIRKDLSSIYLTSYQQLKDFKVASELYQSYKIPPITPSLFTLPQIALNSNRIVINASSDSVLLSAEKSIGLSTGGGVNIDATSNYISSNDIRLGSKDAKQSILLGDDTIEILKSLTGAIKDLATILQVERNWPEGVLATSYNSLAGNVLTQINSADGILSQLNNDSLKSKSTKII
jgi:hypothetical protein